MLVNRIGTLRGHLPSVLVRQCASQFSWNIKKFLVEIGSNAKEARYWLKVFQDRDANVHDAFAVMSIDENVFADREMLKVIGSAVAFLNQNDLKTILVHGCDEERGIRPAKQFFHQAKLLSDVLHESGVLTRLFLNGSGIIHGSGNKVMVDTVPLDWALSDGHVPILSSVAEMDSSRLANIVPSKAATLVSSCLQPAKLIHLNATGGIRNTKGKVIGEITFPFSEGSLNFEPCNSSEGMIALATEALSHLPVTSSVVVTSASALLKELFTHRGSGTIFRHREPIHVVHDFDSLDKEALLRLLRRAFKRHIASDYLQTLKANFLRAYTTSSYSALAIITDNLPGCEVPYLDKFVVRKEHQGLGTGEVLWDAVRKDFPSLFWRSKPNNRINPWYFSYSEGSWASTDYIVFWYGVKDPQLSHTLIEAANSWKSTFMGPVLLDEDIDHQLQKREE